MLSLDQSHQVFFLKVTIYIKVLSSLMENWLSYYLNGTFTITEHFHRHSDFYPKSLNNPFNQTISATMVAILLNSNSAELLVMVLCFFDFQEITASQNIIMYLVTEFLVSTQAPQSESARSLDSFLFWHKHPKT